MFEKDDRTGHGLAIAQLKEFLQRRFPDWTRVFSSAQLTGLILKSGGDFREFLTLLRTLVTRAAADDDVRLPLSDAQVDSTCTLIARDRLPLLASVRERLKVIHQTRQPVLDTAADYDGFATDLIVKNALMYLNGEEWYGVHPLLWGEMDKPAPGAVASLGSGWSLVDALLERNSPQAMEVALEVRDLAQRRVDAAGPDPSALRDLSVSWNKVGNAVAVLGRHDEALAAYRSCKALAEHSILEFGDDRWI